MWVLSIISFCLLGGYLLLMALRFGMPSMISDTYYQLENRKKNLGWVFSINMIAVALLMMICLLDSELGEQCLAAIGCAGLLFVGAAPNFAEEEVKKVHKGGAIVAALGCIGWCMTVNWMVTAIIGVVYTIYLLYIYRHKEINSHPWYCAEASAFLDVYLTYWISI